MHTHVHEHTRKHKRVRRMHERIPVQRWGVACQQPARAAHTSSIPNTPASPRSSSPSSSASSSSSARGNNPFRNGEWPCSHSSPSLSPPNTAVAAAVKASAASASERRAGLRDEAGLRLRSLVGKPVPTPVLRGLRPSPSSEAGEARPLSGEPREPGGGGEARANGELGAAGWAPPLTSSCWTAPHLRRHACSSALPANWREAHERGAREQAEPGCQRQGTRPLRCERARETCTARWAQGLYLTSAFSWALRCLAMCAV